MNFRLSRYIIHEEDGNLKSLPVKSINCMSLLLSFTFPFPQPEMGEFRIFQHRWSIVTFNYSCFNQLNNYNLSNVLVSWHFLSLKRLYPSIFLQRQIINAHVWKRWINSTSFLIFALKIIKIIQYCKQEFI